MTDSPTRVDPLRQRVRELVEMIAARARWARGGRHALWLEAEIEAFARAVREEATRAERKRCALAIRLVQERQAQHKAALEGWKEPDGHLVPTEPDPDERHGIRAMLAAAIVEDGYALGAMQKEEPIS